MREHLSFGLAARPSAELEARREDREHVELERLAELPELDEQPERGRQRDDQRGALVDQIQEDHERREAAPEQRAHRYALHRAPLAPERDVVLEAAEMYTTQALDLDLDTPDVCYNYESEPQNVEQEVERAHDERDEEEEGTRVGENALHFVHVLLCEAESAERVERALE